MKTLIALLALVSALVSAVPAAAQFCQDGRGEWIGGVYFPSARPGYDLGGYSPCHGRDYARIREHQVGRYFQQYGWLNWFPYEGIPGGGYLGNGRYGYYDGYGKPLGSTGKGALIGAAAGAGIGIIRGSTRDAIGGGLIGAAGGAIIGALIERRQNRSAQTAGSVPAERDIQARQYPPDYNQDTVRRAGRVLVSQPQQTFVVRNRTNVSVEIWDSANEGGQRWTIRPRGSIKVPRPEGNLVGEVMVTRPDGSVQAEDVKVIGDGEEFQVAFPKER